MLCRVGSRRTEREKPAVRRNLFGDERAIDETHLRGVLHLLVACAPEGRLGRVERNHCMAKTKFAGKKKKQSAVEANANWISCAILLGLIFIAVALLFFFAIAGS